MRVVEMGSPRGAEGEEDEVQRRGKGVAVAENNRIDLNKFVKKKEMV